MGAEAEGTGGGAINDAFNRGVNKDISQFDQPLVSIISVNYTTPSGDLGRRSRSLAHARLDHRRAVCRTAAVCRSSRRHRPTISPALSLFQSTFDNRVPGREPCSRRT